MRRLLWIGIMMIGVGFVMLAASLVLERNETVVQVGLTLGVLGFVCTIAATVIARMRRKVASAEDQESGVQ